MLDFEGLGCPRYSQLVSRLNSSFEYTQFKQALTIELNPIINQHTKLNLKNSYADTLELCQFLEDAWTDGYSFTNISYEDGSPL